MKPKVRIIDETLDKRQSILKAGTARNQGEQKPTFTIGEKRPTRAFLLVFSNKDGTLGLYRTTLDVLRELDPPASQRWRYEVSGEAGVYPTMEEWNAIHGTEGCASPCSKCKRAGYDPLTGQTVGRA